MSGPNTNRSNRRDLLKAAGAAGIIWSAPLVKPVTAFAQSGTCYKVQYDFDANGGTGGFVTPLDNDDDLVPGNQTCATCLPDEQAFASNCLCTSWAGATALTTSAGTVSPSNAAASNTYTAPLGYFIVDARATLEALTGSGCNNLYCSPTDTSPAVTINVSSNFTTATFTDPNANSPALIYARLRILLCGPDPV